MRGSFGHQLNGVRKIKEGMDAEVKVVFARILVEEIKAQKRWTEYFEQ